MDSKDLKDIATHGFMRQKIVEKSGKQYLGKTDITGRERWYEINDIYDPDRMAKLCAFCGIFGLHKFYERRILSGVLYLISLGLFGVLPLVDLISILGGNYRLKDGSYLGRMSRDGKALARLAAGAASSLLIICLAVSGIGSVSARIAESRPDISYESAEDISDDPLFNRIMGR